MEKELFILTKEQLEEFRRECEQFAINEFTGRHTDPIDFPPPVKVLTEEEIEETKHDDARRTFQGTPCFAQERLAYDSGHRNGYNACLSDLGLK